MPSPSPAITEAETEKPETSCGPMKPLLVAISHLVVDQDAEPPSLLVTPATARAASSAASALSSSASAVGSLGS